jgi:hypothetical protein
MKLSLVEVATPVNSARAARRSFGYLQHEGAGFKAVTKNASARS